IADYIDPNVFLDLWTSFSLNNDTGWSKPEYDQLYREAMAAPDDAARYEVYQRMEKMLIEEMPMMPLFFYTRARLVSPKTNYFTTPLDNFAWKYLELED
ncbi:MAG TPA: peptide ABC transporter substrate-binding protein, partial [Candidatus Synoicihabitans sp.]|nr:peptide ABC transporter substrate-binding protein [Candidatus Synoicihabitans sp.]